MYRYATGVDRQDWTLYRSGLDATQHSMTNALVAIDGDSETIMYVQTHHVYDPNDPASWYTIGGYYDDTLIRVDGRWLLSSARLTVTWRERAIRRAWNSPGQTVLCFGHPGVCGLFTRYRHFVTFVVVRTDRPQPEPRASDYRTLEYLPNLPSGVLQNRQTLPHCCHCRDRGSTARDTRGHNFRKQVNIASHTRQSSRLRRSRR